LRCHPLDKGEVTNLTKAGIICCDRIMTVSANYAEEIKARYTALRPLPTAATPPLAVSLPSPGRPARTAHEAWHESGCPRRGVD